jgi:tetratricopeptide (TPR) repeat protein
MLDDISELLDSAEPFKAFDLIEEGKPPLDIAKAYSGLIQKLYWEKKNIQHTILVANEAINYCLDQSQSPPDEIGAQLLQTAKIITYNLASFAWPCWNEPGIEIGAHEQAAGLNAAHMTLRLARQLKKEGQPIADSYWVLGAHYLAAGRYSKALEYFTYSRDISEACGNAEGTHLAEGYIGIAKAVEEDPTGTEELEQAMNHLKNVGTENAIFFANQLRDVAAFFDVAE